MIKLELKNGVCILDCLSVQKMNTQTINSLEKVAFEVISKVEFHTQEVEEE